MRENRGEREREEEERQKEWEDWEKGSARLAVGSRIPMIHLSFPPDHRLVISLCFPSPLTQL